MRKMPEQKVEICIFGLVLMNFGWPSRTLDKIKSDQTHFQWNTFFILSVSFVSHFSFLWWFFFSSFCPTSNAVFFKIYFCFILYFQSRFKVCTIAIEILRTQNKCYFVFEKLFTFLPAAQIPMHRRSSYFFPFSFSLVMAVFVLTFLVHTIRNA